MIDQTSNSVSAAAAMGTVALASILPGVNGDALIGAFAGSVVFALQANDLPIWKRLIYMIVSIFMGYFGAGEFMRQSGLQSFTLAAFALSAGLVTATLAWIERKKKSNSDSAKKEA